jgi:hypothetical protein
MSHLNTTCTSFSWALCLSSFCGRSSGECTTAWDSGDAAADAPGRVLKAAAAPAATTAPVSSLVDMTACGQAWMRLQ